MMKRTQEKELLEAIREIVRYEYLSDLHFRFGLVWWLKKKELEQLEKNEYSLEEWTDAVCYITGMDLEFRNVEEAIVCLEKYLGVIK